MGQTSFTARVFHQHRVVLIVIVSSLLAVEGGCTSARAVRWSNKGHDYSGTIAPTEPVAEPAMAANVALKTSPIGESDSADATRTSNRPNSPIERRGSRLNRVDSRMYDSPLSSYSSGPEESVSEVFAESARVDSSMVRLNAALTDDAMQSQALPQQSLTTLDARIRVDSLLSRAKQLLDLGQLDQARQSAQLAQELGETAQLDYSPDEDRPIDLLRRIEGQLEATRLTDEPRENETAKSPVERLEPETSTPLTKAAKSIGPLAKDASSLARIRRDWSTLFRREKRPTGPESNLAAQDQKSAQPTPMANVRNEDLRNEDLQASHSSEPGLHEAVVMANRSVSLSQPETMTSSSVIASPEIADHYQHEPDSMRSLVAPRMDADMLDARNGPNATMSMTGHSSKPDLETDDTVVVQPELEIVEAAIPFQETEASQEQQPRHEVVDSTEIDQPDWTYFYAIFGVCGLFALSCYRRGAT